jgi:hypothetical protein
LSCWSHRRIAESSPCSGPRTAALPPRQRRCRRRPPCVRMHQPAPTSRVKLKRRISSWRDGMRTTRLPDLRAPPPPSTRRLDRPVNPRPSRAPAPARSSLVRPLLGVLAAAAATAGDAALRPSLSGPRHYPRLIYSEASSKRRPGALGRSRPCDLGRPQAGSNPVPCENIYRSEATKRTASGDVSVH